MSAARKTILLLEDDPDISDIVAEILANEGYRVLQASNGRQGLSFLAQGEVPSLILLDLMMPDMNGWQFRTEQRRLPQVANVPVVVISADGNLDTKAASIEAAGRLKKPITIADLLGVVGRILDRAAA